MEEIVFPREEHTNWLFIQYQMVIPENTHTEIEYSLVAETLWERHKHREFHVQSH